MSSANAESAMLTRRILALFVSFILLVTHDSAAQTKELSSIQFLEKKTRELINGCRTKAHGGTILFTPDGKAHYAALWTRDFAYMVEHAGDLMSLDEIRAALVYILRKPRADGAIPDRVQPDGLAVYVGGPVHAPLGEANLDNPMFLVIAVDEFLKRTTRKERETFFNEWNGVLDRGMDWVPRSEFGLVYNNPDKPHSPYGFTDTVGKTGELFFESLLYWTACQRLAKLHRSFGDRKKASAYKARAELIEKNIKRIFDEKSGAFWAASKDCRQIDIWGNAYALYLKFPLGRDRPRVEDFLVSNFDQFVWRGQVRHLLAGEYWQRMLAPVERERYQNGAYWSTATGWMMIALHPKRPDLAQKMFDEMIADFRQNGVFECVNKDYRQLDSYVVSATNPMSAARKLKFK